MTLLSRFRFVLASLALMGLANGSAAPSENAEIQLLIRGDDMGVSQSVNEACIRCYRQGVMRSVEVIVPGAWFLDAARLLEQNPGLDVGIHLCLTSEWERCKWGPLTRAPSLSDPNGYFRPMTWQRKDFPPDTGLVQAKPKLDEVEQELRAQIELGLRHIKNVTHLTSHMGAPTATPELEVVVLKLAKEYGLPLKFNGLKRARGFQGETPEDKEEALVRVIGDLTPGRWLLVEHPGLDTAEMRALGHVGYENVAADRAGVTHAFTSDRVKEAIRKRKIRLITYRDLPHP